jgi:signal transduction histidine kinase
VELRGEKACVVVRDRGMGIAPEDQERIFRRYERATRGRHHGGMGIGLWVVRQLVEALGGEVRVESRAEAGATFYVELPRQRPPRR